ncbi:MAG: aldose 1-epimerase family protein [Armatimonadetes bacterium]|nr:aldose 1-epimerase family protein [Armatimonadota bacterium]
MARLFGRTYTKKELLDRVGDISQLGGARQAKLVGGMEDGVDVVEFRTGSGLNFTAVPGRALDISIAEFNGRPLAWRSASGEVHAAHYEEPGIGWLRSFFGGLVTTCGLTYAGAPTVDEGEPLGLHGRISSTPASNLHVDGEWDGDEYRMWASGKMRESRLYGENLLLRRKISAVLGQNKLWIDDKVSNEGPRRTPHMFLYHINAGFPVVDAGAELVAPIISTRPRDAEAEVDQEHYYLCDPPTVGFKERCYYHDMATDENGFVCSALINRKLPGGPFGFYVKYKKSQFPKFTQWKMNGPREYVIGMEPANCWVEGRAIERGRGGLEFLDPGETREYNMEIGVLSGDEEVSRFEEAIKSIKK